MNSSGLSLHSRLDIVRDLTSDSGRFVSEYLRVKFTSNPIHYRPVGMEKPTLTTAPDAIRYIGKWHIAGVVKLAVFGIQFGYPAFDLNCNLIHGRGGAADFTPHLINQFIYKCCIASTCEYRPAVCNLRNIGGRGSGWFRHGGV